MIDDDQGDDSMEMESDELMPDDLFLRLMGWFKKDSEHWSEWRKEAKIDYNYVEGEQWTEQEKATLRSQMRPTVVFNRIGPIIDMIAGSEIQNRQEVKFYPREIGDAKVNELYTSAAEWFRDQCDAEDEESDAFLDCMVCGLGGTETRLDFTENPNGDPVIERVDPLEFVIDAAARKSNLLDARRAFRIKDMSRGEARELFPNAEPTDLDAAWARDEDGGRVNRDPPAYDEGKNGKESGVQDDDAVTIVHAQWCEFEDKIEGIDPLSGQKVTLDDGDQNVAFLSNPRRVVKKVWRQAFLGRVLLEPPTDVLCGKISWKFITGKRLRNSGTWCGIVRGMRDPQQWSNKWMSQSMHILNSQAKGGILAESSAFIDKELAAKTYAKPDAITWTADGAISRGAIMKKPGGDMPSGFFDLMQFAVSSVRDVSGINLEMMGQREGNQPGILEYQRRQAGMTVMARYFSSLRRYRKNQGQYLLHLITEYLSDQRLVRVLGDDKAQYIPLMKQEGVAEFDVIVDESPSAPNQKEQTWSIVSQMLPVVGKMLTPELWLDVLQYSPLPTSLVDKFKQRISDQAGNQQPSPEMMKVQADIEAQKAKLQVDTQIKTMSIQADAQAAQERAAVDVQIMRMKAEAELQISRQKAEQEFELRRQEMMLEAELKREQMALIGATAGPGDEANISRV